MQKASAGLAAALLAGATLVAACGSASSTSSSAAGGGTGTQVGSPTPSASGPAVKGGTINVALANFALCLDPQVSPQYQTYEIARNVVDSLVAKAPDGKLVPWLATSWKASADGRHFTFVLRHDVAFSDGTAFDAQAVKRNFDRIVDPATKSLFAAHILQGYTGTRVLGRYEVRVDFSAPNVPFLSGVTTSYLGIESPASWKKLAACAPPVGSGPYAASAYTAQQSVTLTRTAKPYRWAPVTYTNKSGAGYLDAIKFQFVTEESVRSGGLTSGQFQYVEGASPTKAASLKSGGYGLIQATQPGMVYGYHINIRKPPLSDIDVRKALSQAIDTSNIVRALYDGVYPRATSVLASTTHGVTPPPAPTGGGAKAAAATLDAAGWKTGAGGVRFKDGKPLALTILSDDPRDQREQLDVLVAQELEAVGFRVKLQKVSQASGNALLAKRSFGILANAYILDNPSVAASFFTPAGGMLDLSGTDIPAVTAALKKAAGTVDDAAASALYTRATKLVQDNYSVVPVYQLTRLDATSPKLQGVSLDAAAFPYFYNAYLTR